MLTDHLPRVSLAHLPTPLEEMPRLQKALGGGPRLLIKRDDQTGLVTGGNKTRKLEFVVADALAKGADTLLTAGGPQSNHCRQTAAAAVRYGLRCVLILTGGPIERSTWNANLLLDDLLGAEVRWTGERSWQTVLEEETERMRKEGCKPYPIPVGASVPMGAVGYVAAAEELAQQLHEHAEQVDRIAFVSGSGGTHAGLLTGFKALGLNTKLEGLNNGTPDAIPPLLKTIETLARDTAKLLNLDLQFTDGDFILRPTCGGHPYGIVTDDEREAIRLLARTEGILVDPSYTARAFAGMVELIRTGVYGKDETILFWHTGGTTGIFAHASALMT
jgi:D-cysteine desulfhydrase